MYKNKIFTGVLAISTIISNLAFADGTHTDAKGTGNAKTTLETGITIEEIQSADFGTITRFGKNPEGWVFMDKDGNLTSNTPQIVTTGTGTALTFKISGPPGTVVQDVSSWNGVASNSDGSRTIGVNHGTGCGDINPSTGKFICSAKIHLDEIYGDLPDGEYSTTNPNGEPIKLFLHY